MVVKTVTYRNMPAETSEKADFGTISEPLLPLAGVSHEETSPVGRGDKRGRPRICFTPSQLETIAVKLALGESRASIAKAIGCSVPTLSRALPRKPKVAPQRPVAIKAQNSKRQPGRPRKSMPSEDVVHLMKEIAKGTPLKTIAEQLGSSVSTLYRHFSRIPTWPKRGQWMRNRASRKGTEDER